ncbi:MAG TPA: PEGA domain-containing protein [Anaeromyxobacteraceae bacterium]|nr:PEGA domain-containing protein [Anaeromyxobacteraceae bacterium]
MRTLALAAALAAALPARAGEPLLVVAALKAPPHLTFTGKNAGEAVAREARQTRRFDVMGPDELERTHGRAAARKLSDCADDVKCLAEAARVLGAGRAVAGWLRQTESSYKVGVVHVDAKKGEAVASFTREVPIASRRLLAEVAAATPALLRGEKDAPGTLVVSCNVQGAEVTVGGAPRGKTPVTLELRPGRYQVEVSKPGHIRQDPHWVEVKAGEATRDEVKLYPVTRR